MSYHSKRQGKSCKSSNIQTGDKVVNIAVIHTENGYYDKYTVFTVVGEEDCMVLSSRTGFYNLQDSHGRIVSVEQHLIAKNKPECIETALLKTFSRFIFSLLICYALVIGGNYLYILAFHKGPLISIPQVTLEVFILALLYTVTSATKIIFCRKS